MKTSVSESSILPTCRRKCGGASEQSVGVGHGFRTFPTDGCPPICESLSGRITLLLVLLSPSALQPSVVKVCSFLSTLLSPCKSVSSGCDLDGYEGQLLTTLCVMSFHMD